MIQALYVLENGQQVGPLQEGQVQVMPAPPAVLFERKDTDSRAI